MYPYENLEKQWKMFVQQIGRKQQVLNSLQQKPMAPTYILSALQAELTSLDCIYTSYKSSHINSNSTSEEGIYLEWCITFQQMYQEKLPTILNRCTKVAH